VILRPSALAALALLATSVHGETPVYLDPDKPREARIQDLLSRLTVSEKISQLSSGSPAIPRLDVPAYDWWNESLHGVARAGRATVFPQAIGLAATFDPELLTRIASVIGDEARAKHHAAARAGFRERYRGLTFWTPNINIFRDPRWGRGQETYGEDPYLTARLGTAYVRGLQGDDPRYLKAAACAKHFVVHSGPEADRHHFDAVANAKDLTETYFPAFKALVKAGVETVMCAYNRTNGEPCCGSRTLLVDLLRGSWGFQGHMVSDCGALDDFDTGHKVTRDRAESTALALKSGTDLACTDYSALNEALKRGLVTEADIDAALTHLLRTRFKLGLFDPDERVPYAQIPTSAIGSEPHRRLAREAAVKSLVLLKNQDGVLPLRKDLRKVYVTGPLAADAFVLVGNYHGLNEDLATVVEGVLSKVSPATTVEYRQGALLDSPVQDTIDRYTGTARDSEVTIAVLGISNLIEGEEGAAIASKYRGDRLELGLPASQLELLKALRKAAKKLVVVLMGGSPIATPEIHELADAVLFVWYPGEEGGRAIADVIFGDASPSGRLPITFPRSADQLPPFADYSMVGRTYRYMKEEPLYPFGFGLSYSSFRYGPLELAKKTVKPGEATSARTTLTNTGGVVADEIAQLYVSVLSAPVRVPLASLCGMRRLRLEPGESKVVEFSVEPAMLGFVDEAGKEQTKPGSFRLTVGGASPGARPLALGAGAPAQAVLTVR